MRLEAHTIMKPLRRYHKYIRPYEAYTNMKPLQGVHVYETLTRLTCLCCPYEVNTLRLPLPGEHDGECQYIANTVANTPVHMAADMITSNPLNDNATNQGVHLHTTSYVHTQTQYIPTITDMHIQGPCRDHLSRARPTWAGNADKTFKGSGAHDNSSQIF